METTTPTVTGTLLSQLEREHRQVEKLFARLEKADDDQQEALVGELEEALAKHMRVEEEQVYPAMREIDEEMGEEAQIEHDLGRDGLATLRRMIGEPGFGAAVAMLKAGIEHHVEEEETEAFPKLRKAFGLKAPAKPKKATRKSPRKSPRKK